MVWKMRQQIEFQKSRATMQALMSQKGAEEKHIKDVFDDLRESFFPYDKNERKADIKRMRDAMYSELARGPLSIEALTDPNQKKVQTRLARGQTELQKKQKMTEAGKLTRMDPMEKARQRSRTVS